MNKLIICILLLLFTCIGIGQNNINDYLKGYIEHSGTFEQNASVIQNDRYYPIIEVEIIGKKYNFLFDTGAMVTVVSDKIIDIDKIKEDNKITISGGASTDEKAKQTEAYTVIENIKINDIEFNDILLAVVDLDQINKHLCNKIDGIIGMNLIKLCNWKIDIFNGILSFSDRVFKHPDQSKKIALSYHQGLLPLVDISHRRNKFKALLDTGFDGTLQLFSDFKTTNKMKTRKGEGYYTLMINQMESGKREEIILDKLSIGNDFEIKNVTAYILDGKPLLGMGILKEYITLLNFAEDNMILVPKSTESAIGVHRDFGAKFCINNRDELQVCFMWDGSQLKKNGVKVGDKITAINNNPIDRITEEQYCNFTKIQKEDSTLTLTFKTRDGEKTIEIHK